MVDDAGTPLSALRVDKSFVSPHLAVRSVLCRAHASGRSPEEPVDRPRIILPRRGVFIYHLHRSEFVADANTAFLLDPGDVCRVSHPVDGGDDCTVLIPGTALLEEVFGEGGWLDGSGPFPRFTVKRIGIEPRLRLGLWALHAGMEEPEAPLLAEEIAMHLLDGLVQKSLGSPATYSQQGWVERARAFLASAPSERHSLDTIGKAVHCSPFHLARHFRRATGLSLHQYLTAQRMDLALRRLADGEVDLSRLALDLGFASHSHFSARFRKVFGIPPHDARSLLTSRKLAEMRRILTAPPPAPGLPS